MNMTLETVRHWTDCMSVSHSHVFIHIKLNMPSSPTKVQFFPVNICFPPFGCLRMISQPLFILLFIWWTVLLFTSFQCFLLFYSLISGRTITNNLPSVPLPRVPNLPLNLPQMPSFSAPSWMGPLCDSTCVWASWAPSLLTVLDIRLL